MFGKPALVLALFDHAVYIGYLTGKHFVCDHIDIGENIIIGSRLVNTELLKELIGGYLKKRRIKAKNTLIILNTSECLFRFVALPPLSSNDLDGLVRMNLRDYFPVPLEGFAVDYKVLTRDVRALVMLAALPEAVSEPYVHVLLELGLKPFALNIFHNVAAGILAKARETALIVTGHSSRLNIMIIDKGTPRAVRDILIASSDELSAEIIKLIRFYELNDLDAIYTVLDPVLSPFGMPFDVPGVEIRDFMGLKLEEMMLATLKGRIR